MASTTTNITIPRLHTWFAGGPGTPVYNWRETAMATAITTARALAPVNNPLNAQHRGGTVGTYLAGLQVQRTGNKYGRGFALSATADHSGVVETGRSASRRYQTFSWTAWGGQIDTTDYTGARQGSHVIERSIAIALAATT